MPEQSPKRGGRRVFRPHELDRPGAGEGSNTGVGEIYHRPGDVVRTTGRYRCNGGTAVCPHRWTTTDRREAEAGSHGARHRVHFPELPDACTGTAWILEEPVQHG